MKEEELQQELQKKLFMKQLEHFSQNRKLRRQFGRKIGMFIPAVNYPYRKDMVTVDKSISI